MKIQQLSEVIYKIFSDGRPKATAVTITEPLISQMCILALGDIARRNYYDSKKNDEFGMPDFSTLTPLLKTKKFQLGEANAIGCRIVFIDFDLVRLPENSQFTNVYPIGQNCDGDMIGEITQVDPGEENFYLTPDFNSFMFFVPKGRNLYVYHVPPCIKEVDVEAAYIDDELDISLDAALAIANYVLSMTMKVNGVPIKLLDNNYSPQPREIKHQLQEAQAAT